MHRVHHSNIKNETDSNYGNILSIWDKLFHTYLAQPEAGHEHMRIGLDEFQEEEKLNVNLLLKLPIYSNKQ